MTKADLLKAGLEFGQKLDPARKKDDLLAEVRALAAKATESTKPDGATS